MNDFKEWLSDYLRYFMLAGVIILVLAAAIFGINVYSRYSNKAAPETKATEQETTPPSETVKETEKKETEPETKKTEETETEKMTETKKAEETESTKAASTEPPTEPAPATEAAAATEATPVTEAVPETEPAPVYLTLKGACYIRSGPSYEAEIIGEYWAGTTVRFIEDAGGWYKVEVDGMIGYMGARFFK